MIGIDNKTNYFLSDDNPNTLNLTKSNTDEIDKYRIVYLIRVFVHKIRQIPKLFFLFLQKTNKFAFFANATDINSNALIYGYNGSKENCSPILRANLAGIQ